MKYSLTTRRHAVPYALVITLFFMWGFARAILDVLNKHFQLDMGVSLTRSAWVQVVTYLGYFLMAVPAGLLINRFGYKRGVVTGLMLFAAGAFAFAPANGFGGYVAALFVIACGLAFLEVSANPYATELGPAQTAASRLNFAQSFNGLGSALAPVVVGGFLFGGGGSVTTPYIIMGAVVLVVALVFGRSRLPEIAADGGSGLGNLRQLMRNRAFVFGLAALLAYEVSEISLNSYFINFTTGMGWLAADRASYLLGLSLFIFMGGRFAGSWAMRHVAAPRMLLWCGCGSVACIALLFGGAYTGLLPAWLCMALLMANYLCEAIMFPTIFSLAVAGLGAQTKSAASVLMMTPVGGCGFLLMALMADATASLALPLLIPLVGYVVVMLYARRRCRG